VPIKDGRLADLCGSAAIGCGGDSEVGEDVSPTIVKSRPWNWVGVGVARKRGRAIQVGVVCCARDKVCWNALNHMHLGRRLFSLFSFLKRILAHRDHRLETTAISSIYGRLCYTPAQEAPFSVHRMALAGKELGTDVGQWFGPSVAAGAIKYFFFSPISSLLLTYLFSA
jgi:cysteine protease ATG4